MRGQRAQKRIRNGIAKKQMPGVRRVGRLHPRTITAELLERAGKSGGIACKLYRGSVGQKFALAADGSLNQPAKENADAADDQQRNSDEWQRIFVTAAATARIQQNPANSREAENSEKNAHELDVEPHIAVENMAELVANDALQFVARQL